MNNQTKTALVTGANSGFGFESAAQLAEDGYGRIILATRTMEKAELAKEQLIQRTGKHIFEGLAVDLSEPKSAQKAVDMLDKEHFQIDVLILNAGMNTGPKPVYNSDGVELTFASQLIGHQIITMRLLAEQRLSKGARIVIAGSEGARGNVPGMNIPDFDAFAQEHFDGDMEAALTTIAKVQSPYKYNPMNAYVTAKVYVAWWAAALSRKLPKGITVNAVSPGSVSATNWARNAPLPLKIFMSGVMSPVLRLFGQAGTVSQAARRYLDAANFDDKTTGKFFASPPGKGVGKLEEQKEAHFFEQKSQEASWNVISRLAGIAYPTA